MSFTTLTNTSFTVFDLETTGLAPEAGDRIVEIAGVRVEGGVIDKKHFFLSLVNPEREVPWEAKQVHRIATHELRSAPTIMEVLPNFLTFSEGSILVAHHAAFDVSFLEAEKELCWGYVEIPECLCTMCLSKAVFSHETRHTLDVVVKRLQLPLPTIRHRALPDVLLTAEVFLKLIEVGGIQTLEELREKASSKTVPCP